MLTFRLLNQNYISENLEKYQKTGPILDNLQDSKYIAISAEDNQEILGLTIGEKVVLLF